MAGSPSKHHTPLLSFAPSENPTMSAARVPSTRPTTAPVRPRAPATMIDQSPSARVPGYTGHQPGIVAESLIGRSYAYITGFRADLLKKDSSTKPISEYKRGVSEGTRFEPSKVTQAVDASIVPRPLNAPDAQTVWKSKAQYNDTLNLSADGRMPGYTGHVPHFKFQGSIGLPFAKACQKGDHLRPPDGSHNTYEHVNPHHKQGRHIDKAVSGYSGFMSYVKTLDAAMTQKQNAGVSLQLEDLNKTNAHYTPSMLQSISQSLSSSVAGTPRVPKPENPCPDKQYAVGYCGYIPGTYVLHHAPDRYNPKTSTPMDIAIATPGKIYLGDLTQEWNLGQPYKRSQQTYGEWSPVAALTEKDKPKSWAIRKL